MEHYDKKKHNIASLLFLLSVLIGLGGLWIMDTDFFLYIMIVIIGVTSLIYGKDIVLERTTKFNLNFKFFYYLNVIIGVAFIIGGTISIAQNWGNW